MTIKNINWKNLPQLTPLECQFHTFYYLCEDTTDKKRVIATSYNKCISTDDIGVLTKKEIEEVGI